MSAPEKGEPVPREPVPMDLRAPLPTGTWVLEASAGTGKTYTIAGLVTRYVAEGVARLDQVLAVTFGRAATGELRARVRERLLSVRDELADPVTARNCSDPVVEHLAQGTDDEVRLRRQRLVTALAGFDAATVATTHEFCQQVLRGLGVAADLDAGTSLVESLDDLVAQVCADLFLRHATLPGSPPLGLDHQQSLALARTVVRHGQSVLLPEVAAEKEGSPAALRVRFATGVRREVERRKRAQQVLGFDDLLTRVRDALVDPVSGPVARARLQERFRIVLVDEFQDTDPVQWELLRLAFHGSATLIVIGDPKQAIYAFRGADVRAYLAAARLADHRATLDTSWRSDPHLLQGLQTLMRGAALGDPEIVVRPVQPGHKTALLGPAPDSTPVRLRQLRREGLEQVRSGLVQVDAARRAVASDVAIQVGATLAAGITVRGRDGEPERPLQAADIAVLVRTGKQATAVREALLRAGISCVLTGTHSVFDTAAALDWLLLLEAVEQPHRAGRVRRAALTALLGWTAAEVDARGSAGTDALGERVRDWAHLLAEHGVAAMFAAIGEQQRLAARLLCRTDGERLLTDLRHVAESLHAAALDDQLGLAGLITWLRERVTEAAVDPDAERSRRLDTDAAAVQVATVHTSKGLEFPVVLVPFAWDGMSRPKGERTPSGHDGQGRRTLHIGGQGSTGYDSVCLEEDVDEGGEELRLLYVAATRAISRLVLWWVPTENTRRGPLHRLLFTDGPASGIATNLAVPGDREARERLEQIVCGGPGVCVETVGAPGSPVEAPEPGVAPELSAASFDRAIDLAWRRTSYSGLTRDVHDSPAVVGSEPQVPVKDDEEDVEPGAELEQGAQPEDAALLQVPSPMADLPAGAAFGTLVHAVLEGADLSAGDPLEQLRAAAEGQLRWRGGALSAEDLADALLPAVSTSLGPLADGLAFRQITPRNRLVELDFELPLCGGDDDPGSRVLLLGRLASLLREHLPEGDPVRGYAGDLESALLRDQPLRGYLTGSLDVVVRVGSPTDPRYVVVDHKTNRLAERGAALTAWHYRRQALDEAVLAAHYPLQALLYCVALHRFLRWRQPGYDPARHLGGVLYLFLRGMCGPQVGADAAGEVPGVWAWKPPAALVVALSDLLAGNGS